MAWRQTFITILSIGVVFLFISLKGGWELKEEE